MVYGAEFCRSVNGVHNTGLNSHLSLLIVFHHIFKKHFLCRGLNFNGVLCVYVGDHCWLHCWLQRILCCIAENLRWGTPICTLNTIQTPYLAYESLHNLVPICIPSCVSLGTPLPSSQESGLITLTFWELLGPHPAGLCYWASASLFSVPGTLLAHLPLPLALVRSLDLSLNSTFLRDAFPDQCFSASYPPLSIF